MRSRALLILSTLIALPLRADDGAASIAAGGIILMKHEPHIVMAKELLEIGISRVNVDYEFRNDSDEDITTGVTFPVPGYTWEGTIDAFFGDASFDDFNLSVDGKPIAFSTEIRAYVAGHEITSLLRAEHIDIASFGHTSTKDGYDAPSIDFDHASIRSRNRLLAAGAFKDRSPNWTNVKKYYWTQIFPAHKLVHIEHRYSPVLGGTNSVSYGLTAKIDPNPTIYDKYSAEELGSLCLSPTLENKLLKLVQRKDMSIPFNYVDFILTTANTWKTPIEDFTLIVDRPQPNKSIVSKPPAEPRPNEVLVSFCWSGPVEKTDAMHYTAHLKDFIPSKELRIGFINVDQQDPRDY